MKILVCIKQVPDIDSLPGLNQDSSWIDESKPVSYRMNRYDEYALEAALILKDNGAGIHIDALTIGPARASAAIKKAIEKGADEGFHILTDESHPTAYETSLIIAGFAREKNYDLILTGVMSEDLMQFQVGPMTASILSIPCAISAVEIYPKDEFFFEAHSEIEGGFTEKILIKMPCLITVQTGTSRPRYPSLSNIMRAKNIDIKRINAQIPHDYIPRETFSGVKNPPVQLKGIELKGTISEKAARLIQILHERSLI